MIWILWTIRDGWGNDAVLLENDIEKMSLG